MPALREWGKARAAKIDRSLGRSLKSLRRDATGRKNKQYERKMRGIASRTAVTFSFAEALSPGLFNFQYRINLPRLFPRYNYLFETGRSLARSRARVCAHTSTVL
jgi:hypothetical protein